MDKISDGFKGERSIVTPYSIRKIQADNFITSQLFITHIGYYPIATHHFKERSNGAPENILILCNEGRGTIKVNDEEFRLHQNQIFIIPKETPHAYFADIKNPWSIYWIHYKGSDEQTYASITGRIITLKNVRINKRLSLFEEIFHNLEMGYNIENLEYVSICFKYFLATIKYQSQFAVIHEADTTDIIQKSIFFMKQNISNNITLEDLALHVSYSVGHYSNIFSQKTSYAPIEYYNKLKIQKACSLLEFSDMKIKEIAYYLGYYDQFHFSKAFNAEMGISPKEFKKRYYVNPTIRPPL